LIGGICQCTGPLTNNPGEFDPYKAWIDTVNASGGINGHPIRFVFFDDKSNPGLSVNDVHTLVQSDHVIAILDATAEDQGWASYVQGASIPVVGSGNSTTPFYANPDFYPEGQTQDAVNYSVVAVGKAAGGTRFGNIYCAEAPQCQAGVSQVKQAAQKVGVPFSSAIEVSASAPNYTAACLAAQQAHTDSIFVADAYAVVDKVASDCAHQGYHPIWVADGLDLAPSFANIPGGLYANVTNVPYFANTPEIQTMNAAFDKYYPGMRSSSLYQEAYASMWASGLLFADAAKAGGLGANGTTPTSAELIKGLESLHGDTLDGMAPPLTFTAGQPHPVHCWFEALMKNGKASLPNGTATTCEQ
jgi:branched-chain amino acid transport system substrate-binding protein